MKLLFHKGIQDNSRHGIASGSSAVSTTLTVIFSKDALTGFIFII